jgi:hypothetical protein
MQRRQRTRQCGWVDGLSTRQDAERDERPGEPPAGAGACQAGEQEQAGDAGQRQHAGQQELLGLR